MGYSDSSKNIGVPSLGLGDETIATILDLLQTGWLAVLASREVDVTTQEPDIAGRLGREMLAEKKRRDIRNLRFEEEVGTRSSLQAPKVVGRIDIKVIYSFIEEEYFGIECKRVSSCKADRLAQKYVLKGVARFVIGKYSAGHDWAAMVGFVIDGRTAESVKLVVDAMARSRKRICMRGAWVTEKRFGDYRHLYCTRHIQARSKGQLNILHLFLSLN